MILKTTSIGNYTLTAHFWLMCLRILVGAFILTHGYPKLIHLFSGNAIEFTDPFGLGASFTFGLVVFAEFLCGVFIILGLFTRLASIPLIITMVFAFLHHSPDPFAVKEKALLYLLIFITLFVFGGGKFSLDALIGKK